MTERITSMPEQVSMTCVQLAGQEIELARGEMTKISGGCFGLEEDPSYEDLIDDICDDMDFIEDLVSEWWASVFPSP